MKKVILFVLCMIAAFAAFAQTDTLHMSFRGIPIDGTLSSFIGKMQRQGYEYIETDNGLALMTGEFAATEDCIIGIRSMNRTDLVCKVGVIFPETDVWSFLYSKYFSLKEMLSKKYGRPADCIEEFQSYSEPDDDMTRMLYVRMDKCKYTTRFETEKGDIELRISKNDSGGSVVLMYEDKINSSLATENAMNDL